MNGPTFSYLANGTYVQDIPGGYIELPRPDEIGPTQTERDAARWNAFIGGTSTNRAQLRELLESFICPSCESAGIQWRVLVNPLTAAVVPWDVMGDSRAFAFVCDECAIGSAVVL